MLECNDVITGSMVPDAEYMLHSCLENTTVHELLEHRSWCKPTLTQNPNPMSQPVPPTDTELILRGRL